MIFNSAFTLFLAFITCVNFQTHAAGQEESDLLTQWFTAVYTGNLLDIQKLIGKVDVNAQNDRRLTALTIASTRGNENVVKLLLNAPGIDVNAGTGSTPLMHAVVHGQEHIVKILLQAPNINVNAKNKVGVTPLMHAIYKHEKIVNQLLQAPNIKISAQPDDGKTALEHAIEGNCSFTITAIRDKLKELSAAASKAVAAGDCEALKKIIYVAGPDIIDMEDSEGDTLLHKAFLSNSANIILILLQNAKDLRESFSKRNKNGQIPLELINPSSSVFLLCLDLAFEPQANIISRTISQSSKIIDYGWSMLGYKKITPDCAFCAAPNCTKRCGKCKKVYYCSIDCQKEQWKFHKFECEPA